MQEVAAKKFRGGHVGASRPKSQNPKTDTASVLRTFIKLFEIRTHLPPKGADLENQTLGVWGLASGIPTSTT